MKPNNRNPWERSLFWRNALETFPLYLYLLTLGCYEPLVENQQILRKIARYSLIKPCHTVKQMISGLFVPTYHRNYNNKIPLAKYLLVCENLQQFAELNYTIVYNRYSYTLSMTLRPLLWIWKMKNGAICR